MRSARLLYSFDGARFKRVTRVRGSSVLLVNALAPVVGQADARAVGSAEWAVGNIFWMARSSSVANELKTNSKNRDFREGNHSQKPVSFSHLFPVLPSIWLARNRRGHGHGRKFPGRRTGLIGCGPCGAKSKTS